MKRYLIYSIIPVLFLFAQHKKISGQDTVRYFPVRGVVLDRSNNQPVTFASVYTEGYGIGTVTNSEGEFVLKVPERFRDGKLGISSLGYRKMSFDIAGLNKENNVIMLEPSPIPIREVTIRTDDPLSLIRGAFKKVPDNYSTEPVMMTAFYRESIKQRRYYVSVSEAVLDIYKSPCRSLTETDRIRIFKGRRSIDVDRMDTLVLKLQGGPYISFQLDLVKNPGDILSADMLQYYNFSPGGVTTVDDRQAYVILFDQKDGVDMPLYAGKMYIDAENLAFTGFDFGLSEKEIDQAADYYIMKRPPRLRAEVPAADYLVRYRKIGGLWYLNHVRADIEFKLRWKRQLFATRYQVTSEMAVTDIDRENINKFRYRESLKLRDILTENLKDFIDPDFWGDYNVIKPDESIEEAIEKLSDKLKRR